MLSCVFSGKNKKCSGKSENAASFADDIRDCAIIIRRGGSKTRGGAQCKLTALGRGVTCKFLGKWGGGGGD